MTELQRLKSEVARLKKLNPDAPVTQYAAKLAEAEQLLDDAYTEMLAAGFHDDQLLARVRAFLGK